MNTESQLRIWDLCYPQAGATGVAFARGRLDATNVLWVHAPPPMLTVEVRSDSGERLAYARDLTQTADRPMARLTARGEQITREDLWPTQNLSSKGMTFGASVYDAIHWHQPSRGDIIRLEAY